MELKELFTFLKKYQRHIIISTVAFGVIGLLASLLLPTKYEASTAIYVRREAERTNERYYTYDGYYSQQAAKEYTDTVVGLLKTTSLTKRAVELAHLSTDPRDLSSLLKIKKVAPQVITTSISRKDEKEALTLLTAVVNATSERVQELNKQGDGQYTVGPVNQPIVAPVRPLIPLFLGIGILLGFGFGLLLAAFREYYH